MIPDFIPLLGYLDDLIVLPGLIWLAIRLLPPSVIAASRVKAYAWMAEHQQKPKSVAGAVLVVAIWTAMLYLLWRWVTTAFA